MTASPAVRVESGEAVIALHDTARIDLLAELQECRCAAPKSIATIEARQRSH